MALQLYFGPSFGADKAARQNGRDGGWMHAVVRAECLRPQLQKGIYIRTDQMAAPVKLLVLVHKQVWRLIPYM